MRDLPWLLGLTSLLLGPSALAGTTADTCPTEVCDASSCTVVDGPCGWPCGDLSVLEVHASTGGLSDAERRCVAGAWETVSSTAARAPFHEVLAVDAAARGDWESWDRYTMQHLEVTSAPEVLCGDLVALEPRAEAGWLGAGEVACLERRRRTSVVPEERLLASRLLIRNAQHRFDRHTWHALVQHHFVSVAPNDRWMAADVAASLTLSEAREVSATATELLSQDAGPGAVTLRAAADLSRLASAGPEERASIAEVHLQAATFGVGADWSVGVCAAAASVDRCCVEQLADQPACAVASHDREPRAARRCAGPSATPRAMLGMLSAEERSCLGTAMVLAGGLADQRALSALLRADAWAAGDLSRWEQLAVLHLERVDPNDPDVSLALARHRSNTGGTSQQILTLVDAALEGSRRWSTVDRARREAELHTLRVDALTREWHEARAMAALHPTVAKTAYAEQRRQQVLDAMAVASRQRSAASVALGER